MKILFHKQKVIVNRMLEAANGQPMVELILPGVQERGFMFYEGGEITINWELDIPFWDVIKILLTQKRVRTTGRAHEDQVKQMLVDVKLGLTWIDPPPPMAPPGFYGPEDEAPPRGGPPPLPEHYFSPPGV